MSVMLLIRGADVYAPDFLGSKDVLVAGGKIIAIEGKINAPEDLDCRVIDANGLKLTPGLVDVHVHIAGGGGDGGPATRTPEVQLQQLVAGGTTTAVGCIGTDGHTRTTASLVMKAKAIREQGLSAWVYTGSYQVPAPTLTGEVAQDLALIDEIIGVGETAIADIRSSSPTLTELVKLGKATLVGGLLGSKAGVIHLHMGNADNPFELIYRAAEESDLPISKFYPTHVNRNPRIIKEAVALAKQIPVDITAATMPGELETTHVAPGEAVRTLLEGGAPIEHITMSSDGCGSLPDYDGDGNLIGIKMGLPAALFANIRQMVREDVLPLDQALKLVTSNPARVLKLDGKGGIAVGKDADFLLLDADLNLQWVFAAGESWMEDGAIVRKGNFE
ncbi:beta-aspartyl-peptidase [Aestuariispira insulae]|uniref:Isoaspartyl dipeptidase n=1 Tax=Aestuariispira insulae TaxID=1461337 RepID=A0A3D9H9I5_9PROT|nr:beta-aspartyl-peptidase [Aestuariispira insulae]RED46148.1 beta-aspartyl-dipeptidase (metallo-type) [Aestuariispira insulae]